MAEVLQLSHDSQLSLWEAMILRAAGRGGCDVLFREDLQDGFVHDGVTVTNPFTDVEG